MLTICFVALILSMLLISFTPMRFKWLLTCAVLLFVAAIGILEISKSVGHAQAEEARKSAELQRLTKEFDELRAINAKTRERLGIPNPPVSASQPQTYSEIIIKYE